MINKKDNLVSIEEFKFERSMSFLVKSFQPELEISSAEIVDAFYKSFTEVISVDTKNKEIAATRLMNNLEPNPCFNKVCSYYKSLPERLSYCKKEHECHSCQFQLIEENASLLNSNIRKVFKVLLDTLPQEEVKLIEELNI